jgi:hypothetical protein
MSPEEGEKVEKHPRAATRPSVAESGEKGRGIQPPDMGRYGKVFVMMQKRGFCIASK